MKVDIADELESFIDKLVAKENDCVEAAGYSGETNLRATGALIAYTKVVNELRRLKRLEQSLRPETYDY